MENPIKLRTEVITDLMIMERLRRDYVKNYYKNYAGFDLNFDTLFDMKFGEGAYKIIEYVSYN